jgi:hypothetical protein
MTATHRPDAGKNSEGRRPDRDGLLTAARTLGPLIIVAF